MLSGRRLDLLDPSPLDVEVEDIAHGLSRVARWNGQTRGANPFSVAEHSLLVERLIELSAPRLSARWRLAGLLHDAPEYVIGDLISPFKAMVGGDYKALEHRLLAAIHLRFGLPVEIPLTAAKAIKRADQIAAWFEATQLAGFSIEEANSIFSRPRLKSPETIALVPLAPNAAKRAFLTRFEQLSSEAGTAT
ncbi:UNVERIFIED_CONTAM: hypothetical protein GTU68_028555 [Idotea baltica]|nr:hypothetical protein [Idotea baltica]